MFIRRDEISTVGVSLVHSYTRYTSYTPAWRSGFLSKMNRTPPTSPTLPVAAGGTGALPGRAGLIVTTPKRRVAEASHLFPISPTYESAPGRNSGLSSAGCLSADLLLYPALAEVMDMDILAAPYLDFLADPKLQLEKAPTGHGSYSYVFRLAGRDLALKFPTSKKKSKIILQEANMLAKLTKHGSADHHIVPFLGITYIDKSHFKRLRSNELVPGIMMPRFAMNLEQFYQTEEAAAGEVQNWWRLCLQMLDSLSFLKTQKVIHGDIKTANILVDTALNFCLADFTSSKQLADRGCIVGSSLESTLQYCAPEMIESSKESFDTDLYALGLCMLSLITRNEPFQEIQQSKNHGIGSIQQNQWLIAAILKKDPINLNILGNSELYQGWSNELAFLGSVLEQRLPLERCINSISQFHRL